MSPDDELARLRAELEAYRQREAAELRSALAEARAAVVHYRTEAQRNADIGRQIASEAQAQLAALRAELQAFKERETYGRRFGNKSAS